MSSLHRHTIPVSLALDSFREYCHPERSEGSAVQGFTAPKRLKTLAAVLIAASCFFLPQLVAQPNVTKPIKLQDPRKFPVEQIQSDAGTAAWWFFALLNWPEMPNQRGVPDPTRSIGDSGPTVWESFKNESEIFLQNGLRPAGWESLTELPMARLHNSKPAGPVRQYRPTASQIAALGPVDSSWIHYLAEPVMIDGQQICDSNSNVIQYDVRSDRDYFDYVVNNPAGYPLYNIQGQTAALNDPSFTFDFPKDTLEIKASWRILEPSADASRYWTAIGVYWDDKHILHSARIGLTGLHIISKALPNWFWITFEQVDNPTTTYKYFLGQKGAALGPNPNYNSALTPINQQWQQALSGTKWQFYALMDTQTEFVNSSQQPILMSNSQMETYFQPNSSCISCHKISSIGPKQNLRLQLFYPLNPYYGAVNFQDVVNQQHPGELFKAMDFTWSLRNAHYKISTSKTKKKPRAKAVAQLNHP